MVPQVSQEPTENLSWYESLTEPLVNAYHHAVDTVRSGIQKVDELDEYVEKKKEEVKAAWNNVRKTAVEQLASDGLAAVTSYLIPDRLEPLIQENIIDPLISSVSHYLGESPQGDTHPLAASFLSSGIPEEIPAPPPQTEKPAKPSPKAKESETKKESNSALVEAAHQEEACHLCEDIEAEELRMLSQAQTCKNGRQNKTRDEAFAPDVNKALTAGGSETAVASATVSKNLSLPLNDKSGAETDLSSSEKNPQGGALASVTAEDPVTPSLRVNTTSRQPFVLEDSEASVLYPPLSYEQTAPLLVAAGQGGLDSSQGYWERRALSGNEEGLEPVIFSSEQTVSFSDGENRQVEEGGEADRQRFLPQRQTGVDGNRHTTIVWRNNQTSFPSSSPLRGFDRAGEQDVRAVEANQVVIPASWVASTQNVVGRDPQAQEGDTKFVAQKLDRPLNDVPGSADKGSDQHDQGHDRTTEQLAALSDDLSSSDVEEEIPSDSPRIDLPNLPQADIFL